MSRCGRPVARLWPGKRWIAPAPVAFSLHLQAVEFVASWLRHFRPVTCSHTPRRSTSGVGVKVKVLAAVVMSLVIGRAASAAEVCNAPSGLNFRSGPSLHSNVKDVFQESSSFKVLSHHGSWDKVRTAGGRGGYVYSAYVCKSGGSHPAARSPSGIAHWRNPVLGTCVTSPFGRRH